MVCLAAIGLAGTARAVLTDTFFDVDQPGSSPSSPTDWDSAGIWSPVDPPDATSHAWIIASNIGSGTVGIFDTDNIVGMLTVGGENNPNLTMLPGSALHVLQDANFATDNTLATGVILHYDSHLQVDGSIYLGGTAAGAANTVQGGFADSYGSDITVGQEVVIWKGDLSLWGIENSWGDSVLTAPTVKLLSNGVTLPPQFATRTIRFFWDQSYIVGNVVNEDGVIANHFNYTPDNAGYIHIDGDYSQSDFGYIQLHLPDLDTILKATITGDVELTGGQLMVSMTTLPTAPDEYDILDFGALTGPLAWSDIIELPTLGGALSWDLSDLDTQGIIRVVPEPGSLLLLIAAVPALARRRRAG